MWQQPTFLSKTLNHSHFRRLIIVWLAENLLKTASHGESPCAEGRLVRAGIFDVTGNVKDAGLVAPD